jgi:hypothetical protein
MIILKIKIATAFDTSSTVSFEDHPAHITRDRLPLAGWTLGCPLLDVEKHMSPVQALRGPPLAISDERQNVTLAVAT